MRVRAKVPRTLEEAQEVQEAAIEYKNYLKRQIMGGPSSMWEVLHPGDAPSADYAELRRSLDSVRGHIIRLEKQFPGLVPSGGTGKTAGGYRLRPEDFPKPPSGFPSKPAAVPKAEPVVPTRAPSACTEGGIDCLLIPPETTPRGVSSAAFSTGTLVYGRALVEHLKQYYAQHGGRVEPSKPVVFMRFLDHDVGVQGFGGPAFWPAFCEAIMKTHRGYESERVKGEYEHRGYFVWGLNQLLEGTNKFVSNLSLAKASTMSDSRVARLAYAIQRNSEQLCTNLEIQDAAPVQAYHYTGSRKFFKCTIKDEAPGAENHRCDRPIYGKDQPFIGADSSGGGMGSKHFEGVHFPEVPTSLFEGVHFPEVPRGVPAQKVAVALPRGGRRKHSIRAFS